MTTTPQEKTAKEWLKHLPEPLRTEALEACEKFPNVPDELCEFPLCIEYSINWDEAEGNSKWGKVSDQLKSGEILPVEPEQSLPDFYVGMELIATCASHSLGITNHFPYMIIDTSHKSIKIQNDRNNDVWIPREKFNQYFAVMHQPEQSKQQEPKPMSDYITKNFFKEFYEKFDTVINDRFEALQKELDTRCPKPIEDKQTEPVYTDPNQPQPFTSEMLTYLIINSLRSLTNEQRSDLTFSLYERSNKDYIDKKIEAMKKAKKQLEPVKQNELERFKSFLETPLTEETKKNLDAAYERIKATKYEGLTAMDYLLQFGGPDFPNALNENLSAPTPVKLPVTVEEVWELEKGIKGSKCWLIIKYEISKSKFDASQLIDEYRHESTAKFVDAVRKLTKIAEAQNEMRERGEEVFIAWKDNDKVNCVGVRETHYGQIYFHSEQGLKDCIAANEQLWKDYLRIN